MKKLSFSLLFLLSSLTISFAQTNKSFFVEAGGTYTTFQDVKYSTTSHGGIGGVFNLGLHRDGLNAIWGGGLALNFGKEKPNTHSAATSLVAHPRLYVNYLKKVNDKFAVGAHWDILAFYFRKTDGLDNNGIYFLTSSDLFVAGKYQVGKFQFGLDVGLVSFQKERTGFAFSSPQNTLENGDFDYQDTQLEDPLGFKYFILQPIFQQLNIRTSIRYQWKERLSIGYQWTARHFATVENYSTTIGSHQITLRYNITQKVKEAKPAK